MFVSVTRKPMLVILHKFVLVRARNFSGVRLCIGRQSYCGQDDREYVSASVRPPVSTTAARQLMKSSKWAAAPLMSLPADHAGHNTHTDAYALLPARLHMLTHLAYIVTCLQMTSNFLLGSAATVVVPGVIIRV